jgi:hypothetical protein
MGHSGEFQLFANGQGGRDQTVLEGVAVALYTVGAGFSLWGLEKSSRIKNSYISRVVILLCLASSGVMLSKIWTCYTFKTTWYNLKGTMPSTVWNWIASPVKRTSGVWKRIFRLCEIFVLEYKSYENFAKKCKSILVDYLLRQLGLGANVSK